MGYFYIVLFMFIVLAYYYDYKKFTSLRSFWLVVMWITAVCIAAFRYRMGVDSVMYEYEYPEMPTLSQLWNYKFSDSRYQPLYIIFTAIPRTFSKDFFGFQLFHAIVVNGVLFWFFNKYTRHVFTALSLYFLTLYFLLNMEVLRESLAVSVFLLAWPFFERKKWILYYIVCTIAVGFHISAILMYLLPVFWLPGLRQLFVFGKRTLIIIALLFGIGFFIQKYFFDFLTVLNLTDNIQERVDAYKDNDLGGSAMSIAGSVAYLVKFAIYPLMALYFISHKKRLRRRFGDNKVDIDPKEYMTMWNVYIACLTLFITIFHRYINYFSPFGILVISDWAFSSVAMGKRIWRYKYYFWVIVFVPLFSLHIYTSFYGSLNKSGTLKRGMIFAPYKSRINPEEDPNREKAYRYINPWRKF